MILAAGWTHGYGSNQDCALVRYNPNGSVDTTFASGGIAQVDMSQHASDDA